MKYLLDTHVWIWMHVSPERLSSRVASLLSESPKNDELLLSTISVWEFSKLVQKGSLKIGSEGPAWIEQALSLPNLRVVGLTPGIAWHSTQLPRPFHEDPADQIIVSTARAEGATLITKDSRLLAYPHVRSIW